MTPEIAITATAHRCLIALAKAAVIEASGAYRSAGSPGNKEAVLPGWIDGKLALAQHDSDQQTGKIIMVTSAEKLMGSPYFPAQRRTVGAAEQARRPNATDPDVLRWPR